VYDKVVVDMEYHQDEHDIDNEQQVQCLVVRQVKHIL